MSPNGNRQFVYLVPALLIILWTGVESKKTINNIKTQRHYGETTYKVGTIKATWYRAEEICRSQNTRLVSIKDEHAAQGIAKTIKEAVSSDSELGQFWTSGNDLAERGKFYWMSTGEPICTYSNWRRGKPSKEERTYKHWQVSPHCIYLRNYHSSMYWDYGPCNGKRYFVCESFHKKK